MWKKAFFCLALVSLTAVPAFGEERCTVSGEVIYSGDKDVLVCLHSAETFPTWIRELPPAPFTKVIKASQTGRTPFVFTGVPKGDYLIVAFIDDNCNEKLDCDILGFTGEQLQTHKHNPLVFDVNWYDEKFAVQRDVAGIELNFHGQ